MSPEVLQFIIVLCCCTSFLKILTTLSILRIGIGLPGIGFGAVSIVFSAVLAWFVVSPNLEGESFLQPNKAFEKLRPHMEREVSDEIVAQLVMLRSQASQQESEKNTLKQEEQVSETPLEQEQQEPSTVESHGSAQSMDIPLLSAAFLISELQDAFYLGLLFLLPFIVIDLLVMNVLAVLGVQNLSVSVVGLPIKILLFLSLDGWGFFTQQVLKIS